MIVGGGCLSRRPSAFSSDGKLLLVPCGRVVRVFSVLTSEQVSALEGHTDEITCVCLNPSNSAQVRVARTHASWPACHDGCSHPLLAGQLSACAYACGLCLRTSSLHAYVGRHGLAGTH